MLQQIADSIGGVAGEVLEHTHIKANIIRGSYRNDDGSHGATAVYPITEIDSLDQVRINTRIASFITMDVDAPQETVDALIAEYREILGWVTRTPHGAHFGVRVDRVHTTSSRAFLFLTAIQENVRAALGGDVGYTGWSTRNPWKRGAETQWISSRVWTLTELKSWFVQKNLWAGSLGFFSRQKTLASAIRDQSTLGRNASLFTLLTRLSHTSGMTRKGLIRAAEEWQDSQDYPLDYVEVRSIIASVCRRAHIRGGKAEVRITSDNRVITVKDGVLVEMGRRGGQRNSKRQQESRARIAAERARQRGDRVAYAVRLHEDGLKVDEIAAQMTVGVRTVREYLTEARAAKRQQAVNLLREGYSVAETSDSLGLPERTVYRLKKEALEARDELIEEEVNEDERYGGGTGESESGQSTAPEGANARSNTERTTHSLEVAGARGSRDDKDLMRYAVALARDRLVS